MWKLLEPRSTAASTSGTTLPRLIRLQGFQALLSGERGPATAGGFGVGIADDKLRALQIFLVVDLGAHQVLRAHRIDQQLHAALLHAEIALFDFLIEGEA